MGVCGCQPLPTIISTKISSLMACYYSPSPSPRTIDLSLTSCFSSFRPGLLLFLWEASVITRINKVNSFLSRYRAFVSFLRFIFLLKNYDLSGSSPIPWQKRCQQSNNNKQPIPAGSVLIETSSANCGTVRLNKGNAGEWGAVLLIKTTKRREA